MCVCWGGEGGDESGITKEQTAENGHENWRRAISVRRVNYVAGDWDVGLCQQTESRRATSNLQYIQAK